MLLGYFLNHISKAEPQPVELKDLAPGSVVVAVENMQQLRETGLPCVIRFGIVESDKTIICRCCESENIEAPKFIVRKLSAEKFAGDGMPLYTCPIETAQTPDMVQYTARVNVGIESYRLCSYPGDDFVAECLSGLEAEDIAGKLPEAGQHWWTPLKMTLREGLNWLGWKTPAGWLPDAADVQVFDQTHHGIAIESGQVIHFSTRRVPDGKNSIKADSLKEFRDIGDDADNAGGPVKYKVETAEQRLISRNRAVWVFCHAADWGAYDLATNNCEHFSRYCRVGRKESRQVIGATMEALAALMTLIPKEAPYYALIMALRLLIQYLGRILGTPTSGTPVDIQPDEAPLLLAVENQ